MIKSKGSILIMTMIFILIFTLLGLFAMKLVVFQNSDRQREVYTALTYYAAENEIETFYLACLSNRLTGGGGGDKANVWPLGTGSGAPGGDAGGFSPDNLFQRTNGGTKTWLVFDDVIVHPDTTYYNTSVNPEIRMKMEVQSDNNPQLADGPLSDRHADFLAQMGKGNYSFTVAPKYFTVNFTTYANDLVGNTYKTLVRLHMMQTTKGIICLRSRQTMSV